MNLPTIYRVSYVTSRLPPPRSAKLSLLLPSAKCPALLPLTLMALRPVSPNWRPSITMPVYLGLPSKPRLIARTGLSWEEPFGPEESPQLKELKIPGDHEILGVWEDNVAFKVHEILNQNNVLVPKLLGSATSMSPPETSNSGLAFGVPTPSPMMSGPIYQGDKFHPSLFMA